MSGSLLQNKEYEKIFQTPKRSVNADPFGGCANHLVTNGFGSMGIFLILVAEKENIKYNKNTFMLLSKKVQKNIGLT